MSTAHKVFISDSSKDFFSIAVCDAVVKQLRAKNYQVIIDKDTIKPGDEWRLGPLSRDSFLPCGSSPSQPRGPRLGMGQG